MKVWETTIMGKWKHVWITGASSGLGEHAARQLAEKGCHVSVTARSLDGLAALAASSDNISVFPGDVTNCDEMKKLVAEIEASNGPIDMCLFSAGAAFPVKATDLQPENFARTFDVNVMGVVNCVDAVLPSMLARGKGHISWIASVNGYGGIPRSAAYGASKAALIHMAESLKLEWRAKGLKVSVINPGYVRTAMTANNKAPMPFLLEVEDAASKMIAGLEKEKFEIYFPWQLAWILKILNLLPYPIYFSLMKRFFL
ncbi:MAG: oxidoreductase [Hyphomicrobiales bacterium]|nr:MAG: oxidoreductase [Hyphomicrobiales bacterium]